MKRLDGWLGRLSSRGRMRLGWALVLVSLAVFFVFPRDVLPSVLRYLMWFIPLGIGVWALVRDLVEREQRELPPQRRMDGTYEETPRDP